MSTNRKAIYSNTSNEILSKDEIKILSGELKLRFDFAKTREKIEQLAKKIHATKIPEFLSETIVLHLIKDNKILKEITHDIIIGRGGGADITLVEVMGSSKIKIEVKGTGKQNFITVGKKDICSDYLIWVVFDDFFENPKEFIYVYIFKHQFSDGFNLTRVSLRQLLNEVKDDYVRYKLPSKYFFDETYN